MKTTFLSILGLVAFLAFTSCNESKNVPQPVLSAMGKMYPAIKKIDWDHEKDGSWEAGFKNNGKQTSVTFSAEGMLKEIEEEITTADFPQAALDYITQTFPGKKIKEVAKITDSNNVKTYEAEIDGSDYIFDADGNLISKSK